MKLRLLRYKKTIIILTVINVVLIAFSFLAIDDLPPLIPLFYGRPDGALQLSASSTIVIPAIISGVYLFIAACLSQWADDSFIDSLLLATGVIVTLFATFTIYKIISIVGPNII